ncbi:hypothetical protein [Gloeobacter kilaueensis]|uniref:hypothetical protein n=1 Tax=Gloeobacter kilaueensis TaxID=1416614 RepID=UPI00041B472E|nr:hypothetical protein [Gloeobacter kilaueensis]
MIWTAGTATPELVRALPVSEHNRDHRGQLRVNEALQLPEYAEVFCGGDCAVDYQSAAHNGHRQDYEPHEADRNKSHGQARPLPSTAQVAYQQGAGIAENLVRLAEGKPLQPVAVNLRGSLLKLGLGESAAEIYDRIEIKGKIGHLIRQGTYLELLPDISHDFKVTLEWITDGILSRFAGS